jgi:hypothetical protein
MWFPLRLLLATYTFTFSKTETLSSLIFTRSLQWVSIGQVEKHGRLGKGEGYGREIPKFRQF